MVRNVELSAVDGVARPLIAMGRQYPDGYVVADHQHRRAQLIFGGTGVLALATPRGTWVMPPQRGMWIPAGVVHGVRMLGVVSTESIYVEPAAAHGMPNHCQVVGISPFLRSLIAQALDIPPEYDPDSHAGALMALIQHEMRRLPELPLSLPFPAHPRLAGRCRQFLLRPAVHETIEQWMKPIGLSRRAFTRLFRRETGLSFVEWRQQACLMAALPRLVAGEPVTSVALDLGYDNPAAFTTMFKRSLGSSPKNYLKQNG